MFLQLNHQKLEIFKASKQLITECYKLTNDFPSSEKYAMTQQIRRAVLSVHLNLAEGCSRKSLNERKRFFEISRGSLIEIDTALDVALDLKFSTLDKFNGLGSNLLKCFKMLSSMIQHLNTS